jgi:hypothetical protein
MFNLSIPTQFCDRARQESGASTIQNAKRLTFRADIRLLIALLPNAKPVTQTVQIQ